ncbi:MAG TPA: FGGY-family carbohydrate kinase [Vicinamibacterales bacterium]|nr:FGGY-family carbohydrate kinase [Vicinamibacterales bacterium]
MALYLGFDSSTQSLTATVIDVQDGARRIVFEDSIVFDEAFPQYGTRNGVITSDGRTVTAPPRMWADALETMAARLRDSGVDLRRIRAISGSGQQHGSVYLAHGAGRILASLDPQRPLAAQLEGVFSRSDSPVWLDCSTTAQCATLASAAGGDRALAEITGSRAYERFTGAQISKFAAEHPDAYARTERIHLVSSFMATLLCGADAPLEPGDGSGMNLMDLAAREWASACLEAAAPDLRRRLPPLRESWSIAGPLSSYWQRRFGFGPARVVTWSGDNPSSLIGLGLIEEGQLGISLGTSDTVFAPKSSPAPDPRGAGHVFGSPAGGYMALTCFSNGSLARERVRDQYGLDWEAFSARLATTEPGNDGALMVPWFMPEITPTIDRPGPHRLDLDAADATRNVRAVVEGQAMAMRIYSQWFAPKVTAIRATGGAAANQQILQVIADVFDAEVVRIAPPNAASLGAALRAFHADRLADGRPLPWSGVISGFTDPIAGTGAQPRREAVEVYQELLAKYRLLVEKLLQEERR